MNSEKVKKVTNDVKTEKKGKDTKKKQPIYKKLLFWVIVVALLIILFIVLSGDDEKTERIDGRKIDLSKITLSMGEDYKTFNNSVEDFAAVLINDFKGNLIDVDSHSKCSLEDINKKYCYNIKLSNGDKLFIVSANENTIDKILYNGKITDTKYTGKVLGTIARLYIKDLDGDNFEEEINNVFLTYDNLDREEGISYVYSHMKFQWTRNYSKKTYELTFSVSEYENQEQYKETDEYKNAYIETIKNSAKTEINKQIGIGHTLDSYEVNNENGLSDVKIKYEKSELSKYVCASDTQYIAKSLVGSNSIGSLQFECINIIGTIYYVKVENINSITTDEINSNTKYYNTSYIQENTSIDGLKALSESDYKKSCVTYKYKDVLRNPNNYSGKRAYWFGKVLQVLSKTSYTATYRIGVSCTKYRYIGGYSCPDAIYVTYYGDKNFIEDDMVKMYGTMEGAQTYTTVMGASVTIPKFSAPYIDLQ